jgi:hypothetical protein
MNNQVDINISKKSLENPYNVMCQILMDRWKIMLPWCYHGSWKLIKLKLNNGYNWIAQIAYVYDFTYGELHPLQLMQLISYSITLTTIEICLVVMNYNWSLQLKKKSIANHPIFL